MDVVLLESIANLGKLGEVISVRPGFARNFLIPKGKGKYASKENLEEFEKLRGELERKENLLLDDAKLLKEKMDGIVVTVQSNSGEEGRLFGSVGTLDIAKALSEQGFNVERRQIRLPEGSFKQLGTYEVQVHLHADYVANINLSVEPLSEDATPS